MMEQQAAETLALDILGWIVAQEDLLGVFLGASGLGEDDLKTRLSDPELLAAVVDFLLMDDAWVIGFCDNCGVPYERVLQTRAALPGGQQVNWT